MSGPGPFGRIASRLAAKVAPPHLGQVSLARLSPRGYIDADATIYHSDFRLGKHVYIAEGVLIVENDQGGEVSLADKVMIYRYAILETGQKGYIHIGAVSSIHPGCQLKAYVQPILIGEGVMIAANVAIYSYDHGMVPGVPMLEQALVGKAPVIIGNDAWIGTGAIILSGVTIGEGAVVGAGSVVTRDIPANAIAVGNPARILKYRSDPGVKQE
jgi:acetyltransferase-like isoleucine patch superfamily enzyme